MPKKEKVNGYFLFMQDLVMDLFKVFCCLIFSTQRKKRTEWRKKSNQQMMTLASPFWDKLSPAEKDVFNKRAKEVNNPGGGGAAATAGPKDSQGRDLQFIQRRDQEKKLLAQKKLQDVDDMMIREAENLEDVSFYVMHANFFAKTELEAGDVIFVPAEISFIKFSLRDGLMDVYQSFPAPATPEYPIPLGAKWNCQQRSEKIQIPLEFEHSAVTTSDAEVLNGIKKFLDGTKTIFTMPDCEEQCSGVLDRIAQRAGQPNIGLSFLSLPLLLFKLKTARCLTVEEMMESCPTEAIALSELERERFLFWAGLSCAWHEDHTETALCSQATVARWVFTLLDNCCPAFNIQLSPGTHAPEKTPHVETKTWNGLSDAKR